MAQKYSLVIEDFIMAGLRHTDGEKKSSQVPSGVLFFTLPGTDIIRMDHCMFSRTRQWKHLTKEMEEKIMSMPVVKLHDEISEMAETPYSSRSIEIRKKEFFQTERGPEEDRLLEETLIKAFHIISDAAPAISQLGESEKLLRDQLGEELVDEIISFAIGGVWPPDWDAPYPSASKRN